MKKVYDFTVCCDSRPCGKLVIEKEVDLSKESVGSLVKSNVTLDESGCFVVKDSCLKINKDKISAEKTNVFFYDESSEGCKVCVRKGYLLELNTYLVP